METEKTQGAASDCRRDIAVIGNRDVCGVGIGFGLIWLDFVHHFLFGKKYHHSILL